MTASRLTQARPAIRPALKARALLSGAPGSGKTRSGLIILTALVEDIDDPKILVIDTEKESALTYADDFTFDHLRWQPPFEPRELGRVLGEAGGAYDAVMVDSLSHFWRGEGGVLDIAGGKFTGWADARPAHADLVEGILGCDAHVVLCVRAKVAHEQVQEGGKWVVKKLGMQSITDDELEYEINVALDLDMDHSMTVSKSRTTEVPVGRTFKSGHAEDFAVIYRDWLAGGEPPASREVVESIIARLDGLPDAERKSAKQEFMAALGHPQKLTESKASDADALVTNWETAAADRLARTDDPAEPVPPVEGT
jgi:hypothetical protein